MKYEQLWDLLESVQSQIRAFDAKAQIAIGINGVLIGFVVSEVLKIAEFGRTYMFWRPLFGYGLAGASLLASLAAVLFSVLVIRPRIEFKQPRSHFFYCHLVEKYGKNFSKAIQALTNLNEPDAIYDVAGQIMSNSLVCDLKAKRNRPVMPLTGAAILLFTLSILPYTSIVWALAQPSTGKTAIQANAEPISGKVNARTEARNPPAHRN